MGELEERFEEVKREIGNELPPLEAMARRAQPTPAQERLEELKKTLAGFVERGDMDGLVGFVEHMAHRDGLTGLLNRRGLLYEAELVFRKVCQGRSAVEQRTGEQIPFSFLFLDLDRFKNINDTYGHGAGDEALKKVAQVLTRTLRGGDTIGRYGGEEFVVAFMGGKSGDRFRVAEKVRQAIERIEFVHQDQRIPLTASIGVAMHQEGEELENVITRADAAMYQAKQAGRNTVVVSPEAQ